MCYRLRRRVSCTDFPGNARLVSGRCSFEGAGNAGPQLVVLLRAIKAQSAPMTEHQAEARALLVRALEAKYGKSENER